VHFVQLHKIISECLECERNKDEASFFNGPVVMNGHVVRVCNAVKSGVEASNE